MASMALMPVCSGSLTGWRPTMPGRLHLHAAGLGGVDRALAVDRLAQRVDHAAEQGVADRDGLDAAGRLDRLLLLEAVDLAEDDGTDGVLVEVQGEAERAVLELEQLVDRGAGEARTPGRCRRRPRRCGRSARCPTAGVYSSTWRSSASVISLASIVSSAISLLPLSGLSNSWLAAAEPGRLPAGRGEVLTQGVEPAPRRGVHLEVADADQARR